MVAGEAELAEAAPRMNRSRTAKRIIQAASQLKALHRTLAVVDDGLQSRHTSGELKTSRFAQCCLIESFAIGSSQVLNGPNESARPVFCPSSGRCRCRCPDHAEHPPCRISISGRFDLFLRRRCCRCHGHQPVDDRDAAEVADRGQSATVTQRPRIHNCWTPTQGDRCNRIGKRRHGILKPAMAFFGLGDHGLRASDLACVANGASMTLCSRRPLPLTPMLRRGSWWMRASPSPTCSRTSGQGGDDVFAGNAFANVSRCRNLLGLDLSARFGFQTTHLLPPLSRNPDAHQGLEFALLEVALKSLRLMSMVGMALSTIFAGSVPFMVGLRTCL